MTLNTAELSSTDSASEAADAETTGESDSPPNSATERLSKDVVFELLKNQRRRDALRYLEENDGEATLSDMAEFIAAKENDITVEALSSSQRKRVYIGLYQCHLPKMADAGVIDFEKNRGNIELQPLVEQLEPYLVDPNDDDATAQDTDMPTQHLVLAGIVGLCVTAGLLNLPVFSFVPTAGWAVLSTLSLMTLAGIESYQHYVD